MSDTPQKFKLAVGPNAVAIDDLTVAGQTLKMARELAGHGLSAETLKALHMVPGLNLDLASIDRDIAAGSVKDLLQKAPELAGLGVIGETMKAHPGLTLDQIERARAVNASAEKQAPKDDVLKAFETYIHASAADALRTDNELRKLLPPRQLPHIDFPVHDYFAAQRRHEERHIELARRTERAILEERKQWQLEQVKTPPPIARPIGPTKKGTADSRRDLLNPLIEAAQRGLDDPFDAAAIWLLLVEKAEERRPPFIGVSEDGIKWKDQNDELQFLSYKNLRDRLGRKKKTRQGATKRA